jgi:hypothetical protein
MAADVNGGAPPASSRTTLVRDTRDFTHKRKVYDPLSRPFHRIGSRSYDTQVDVFNSVARKERSSGVGHDCGCRNPDDFKSSVFGAAILGAVVDAVELAVKKAVPGAKEAEDAVKKLSGRDFAQELKDFLSTLIERELFGSFLRFIPSWAPVDRDGFGPSFKNLGADKTHNVVNGREAEVEIEGRLSRSYQTHHHRPYTQWSRYYHWAFHVVPMKGYAHLVGLGNIESDDDRAILKANPERFGAINLYDDAQSHLECLMDVGAFSTPPGNTKGGQVLTHPALFYDKRWPFWPQSGDWFWAAGRYVYDCTHVRKEKTKPDPEIPDDKAREVELSPTLINPVKAFAVGRFEAATFDETDAPIPVTRFSFFACKRGGYWDFEGKHLPFNADNYEFAVDLPPVPDEKVSFDVGQVADFDINTLVIRPRLLKKIEFAPYGTGLDSPLRFHTQAPVIQLVTPPEGSLPRMVKVIVPMKDIPADRDAYGFTLTMGWLSPTAATSVKKVTVKLAQLKLLDDTTDNLRMSVSVNGRWVFIPANNPTNKLIVSPNDRLQNYPDDTGIVLFLPVESGVHITAHGMRRFGLGEFLETKPTVDPTDQSKDRRLAVGGVFNVDEKTEKTIKDVVEKKISEVIPEKFWGNAKPVLTALDNDNFRKLLGKAVSDLVGQRRIVVWDNDVDFLESDPKRQHEIACAVAREMSVFPVALLNKPNGPMSFLQVGEFKIGTTPEDDGAFRVRSMLNTLATNKTAITTIEFRTDKSFQVTDGGFIVTESNRGFDYALKVTATIADPDPPK